MASAKAVLTDVMDRNRPEERRHRRAMARQGMGTRNNVGNAERVVSALAGGLLAMWGLRRRGTLGYSAAAFGGELLYRGVSGHCHAYDALGVSTHEQRSRGEPVDINHGRSVDVRHSIHIARPPQELFAIWRDFSTLPQFMDHLERVDVISPTVSHWVTTGPAGTSVEWDAEIVDERNGEWIAWRSVEPAEVPNNGTVMFREASGGGTEVFVTLEAQPPAGKLGELVARMFGQSPDRQVRMALERFKQMTEGQHDFGAQPTMADREVGLSEGKPADLPQRTANQSASKSGKTPGAAHDQSTWRQDERSQAE
jgi:uncharacterized membrane protein